MKRLIIICMIFCSKSNGQGIVSTNIEETKKYKANQLYEQALASKDSAMLAEAYYQKGKIAINYDFKEATNYFLKSLEIVEKKGPSFHLGRLYMRLSALEVTQGHMTDSDSLRTLAKKTFILAKSEEGLHQFFDTPEDLERKINEDKDFGKKFPSKALSYNFSIALQYFYDGNIKKSQELLKKAQEMGKTQANQLFMNTRIDMLLAKTLALQKRFGEALPLINKSEKAIYGELKGIKESEFEFLNCQLVYYQSKNDWKNAYKIFEKLKDEEFETYKADREGEISKLQLAFQTKKKDETISKKDQELLLAQKNIRLQKILSISAFSFLALMSILIFILYKSFKKNEKTSKKNEILLKEQNHRVKNNLQFISSLLNLEKSKSKDQQVIKTIESTQRRIESMNILNRTLYDGNVIGQVNMPDFLEEVLNNVLSSMDFEKIETDVEIKQINLDPKWAVPLGIILNEMVVNTCKHKGNDAKIALKFKPNSNGYRFEYADGGDPNAYFFNKNHNGFGIELIHLQIEQMKAKAFEHGKSIVIDI